MAYVIGGKIYGSEETHILPKKEFDKLMTAVEAARELATKLDEIEEDGGMNGILIFASVHGIDYKGPNYGPEFVALEKALRELDGEKRNPPEDPKDSDPV